MPRMLQRIFTGSRVWRRPRAAHLSRRAGLGLAVLAMVLMPTGAAVLGQAPPSKVKVQPGDTLSDIALRYYGSVDVIDRIVSANSLTDPNRILSGTELNLPAATGPVLSAVVPARSSTTAAAASASASTSAAVRKVTVGAGETLSGIAEREYGNAAFASALAEVNGLSDPNRLVAGTTLSLPPSLPPIPGSTRAPRVCIDPGHGGAGDSGTAYKFENNQWLREADVVLDISLNLAQRLTARGYQVTLTRQTDVEVDLDERAVRCNLAGADLTVSVHLNGVDNPVINGALALWGKAVERTAADLMAGVMQSGLFAGRTDVVSFGARAFPGRVLLHTAMPAVLVEPAFLTNPAEARAMRAPVSDGNSRRAQVVRELDRAIALYFRGS